MLSFNRIYLYFGILIFTAGISLVYVMWAGSGLPPFLLSLLSIEPTNEYQGAHVASLNPDQNFLKQVPPERYQESQEELRALAATLESDPKNYDGWMRVAFIKHYYGDEEGTRDVYEYLNSAFPDSGLPFYNLASLYGYYLKDPKKALPKYERAIELDKKSVSFYVGFSSFYQEVLRDNDEAERILLAGDREVPGNANLYIALGSFYRSVSDFPKAVEYYQKALDTNLLAPGEWNAVKKEIERLEILL